MNGAIATVDESRSKALEVESRYARFLAVAAADEFYECVGVVGEKVYNFLVKAFVEVVAIFEVEFLDFSFV